MQAPILVTGSHRCGSTWVGSVLTRSPGIAYIDEPFHVRHRPGIFAPRFDRWFLYVTRENESGFLEAMERTLAFRYGWLDEIRAIRHPRDAGRMGRDWLRCRRYRRKQARPLLKDPIAFFSAPWLADRFGMEVIVLIRHPATFASSLKRLNWSFDFRHFLDQPLLMRDYLAPFRAEIRQFVDRRPDVIEQAGLLWKIIYHVADRFREQHPSWRFLRHEDLSRDPVEGFRKLFADLQVPFTDEIARNVEADSAEGNPAEAPEGMAHALKRDSRANITNWKARLTMEEVERLAQRVAMASSAYYPPEEW